MERTPPNRPKAVIFDLDHALLDSRKAWQYAVEESVAVACGRRIDVRPLSDEYHRRPWIHALTLLVPDAVERQRCEELCVEVSHRSGLKKLLVHDRMGVALDQVRASSIEIAAVSRQAHGLALKQAQSTGLDRFLAVLAATPQGTLYDPSARLSQCVAFMEREPAHCVVVSAEPDVRRAASAAGFPLLFPAWSGDSPAGALVIGEPAQILASLLSLSL
ncbi:MAG: hypothetical protein ABIP13_07755 [Tepidiformaceae bacterium]